MSKFDDKVAFYTEECKKLGISVDYDLLYKCTKACGPSIYNDDAETVSGSDKSELARVKNNFLKGRLGLGEGDDLDALISHAVNTMGSSNRKKYRAIFYYILSQKTGITPS